MDVSIIVQVQVPPLIKKVIGSGRITGHTFLGWGVLEHPPALLSCAPEFGPSRCPNGRLGHELAGLGRFYICPSNTLTLVSIACRTKTLITRAQRHTRRHIRTYT